MEKNIYKKLRKYSKRKKERKKEREAIKNLAIVILNVIQ